MRVHADSDIDYWSTRDVGEVCDSVRSGGSDGRYDAFVVFETALAVRLHLVKQFARAAEDRGSYVEGEVARTSFALMDTCEVACSAAVAESMQAEMAVEARNTLMEVADRPR